MHTAVATVNRPGGNAVRVSRIHGLLLLKALRPWKRIAPVPNRAAVGKTGSLVLVHSP